MYTHTHTHFNTGLPGDSDGKESACNAGDPGSIPGLGNICWRMKWQPIPVFWPGEFHGQSSLAGYSPWGHKESDATDCMYTCFKYTGKILYLKDPYEDSI